MYVYVCTIGNIYTSDKTNIQKNNNILNFNFIFNFKPEGGLLGLICPKLCQLSRNTEHNQYQKYLYFQNLFSYDPSCHRVIKIDTNIKILEKFMQTATFGGRGGGNYFQKIKEFWVKFTITILALNLNITRNQTLIQLYPYSKSSFIPLPLNESLIHEQVRYGQPYFLRQDVEAKKMAVNALTAGSFGHEGEMLVMGFPQKR